MAGSRFKTSWLARSAFQISYMEPPETALLTQPLREGKLCADLLRERSGLARSQRKALAWSIAHSLYVRTGVPVTSSTVCETSSGSFTKEAQALSAPSTIADGQ